MKKYSVLMSVYKNDDPAFLKIALESIYDQQTRKPDEVVVVFDGKLTESLYKVLDEFQKGREDVIKYYPQEDNHGLGHALKIGSELCSGDYLLRMDSDDISDSKRFEKQIAFAEAHPEYDVMGCDIAEFNEVPFQEKMRTRVCPATHENIVKMAKKRNPMNHVTVCIKKSSLIKAGGYQTLLLLEDYLLWLNMIISGAKFANINESLVFVRIGNGFDSKRGSQERIDGWWKLQQVMMNANMINLLQAWMNMVFIYVFVKTPSGCKKWLYCNVLRK